MKAIVLAAGKSTRIASAAGGLPKPLLDVEGIPVIGRTLRWLSDAGIRDVWINLHYRPDDIRAALGDGARYGVRISYVVEPEILGTAGAFRAIASSWSGTTLVVYGDNLMSFDLEAFGNAHRRAVGAGASATVAVFDPAQHVNSRIAGGRVMVGADGRIDAFVEGAAADAPGFVNAGAYLVEADVAREIPAGFSDFARDVFPPLVATRRLAAHLLEAGAYCIGLDTPESLRVARELIATRQVALA